MATRTFQPVELVPPEPSLFFWPKTIEQLIEVGEGNLQQMIRQHRKVERRLRLKLNNPEYRSDGAEAEMLSVIRSKIGHLAYLKRKAARKPVFPIYRPMDYFGFEDPVVCFIGEWAPSAYPKQIEENWVAGQVVGGPSFIGTRYAVRFNVRVHSGPYLNGHGTDFFVTEPRMMHLWEFQYLLVSPSFSRIWVDNTPDYAPTPKTMAAYLTQGFTVVGI